jgi:hypothetical protein
MLGAAVISPPPTLTLPSIPVSDPATAVASTPLTGVEATTHTLAGLVVVPPVALVTVMVMALVALVTALVLVTVVVTVAIAVVVAAIEATSEGFRD